MKFEKDDISDTKRQAALFAMAPEAVVENRLAGRRDLDNYAKVRCMIDDMIRVTREARGAIKLSGGGYLQPPDVDQLKLREMMSDFAEEAIEGGSDTSSVQKLAESLSAIVETLNSASKGKSKGKGEKGQWTQESLTVGEWQGTSQRQNAAGNRQPWPQPEEARRKQVIISLLFFSFCFFYPFVFSFSFISLSFPSSLFPVPCSLSLVPFFSNFLSF